MSAAIPLTDIADAWLRDLAGETGSAALHRMDGATLLGERAMLGGFSIPGRVSAGGGCRLYHAREGDIALNLARPDDRALLPALFRTDMNGDNDDAIRACIAVRNARDLIAQGRLLGLAIAGGDEVGASESSCTLLKCAPVASPPVGRRPRVLDLSALWAGPLSAHLLWLAGAEVTKVESRTRPDAMRDRDDAFFALLNQGKSSVSLDLHQDHAVLLALIANADIVIEAARPRALRQLGIDADTIVRQTPGLTWVTITGHGALGEAADYVGFGDDCAVAGGLSAALRRATGSSGFVGDAIADPLTGIRAAGAAWDAWVSGRGGRIGVAMSIVVAEAIDATRASDAVAFDRSLIGWAAAMGKPFPAVLRRDVARVSALGADTEACLAKRFAC